MKNFVEWRDAPKYKPLTGTSVFYATNSLILSSSLAFKPFSAQSFCRTYSQVFVKKTVIHDNNGATSVDDDKICSIFRNVEIILAFVRK